MYHALYRKYRPIDFDSVVGQESIVKTLKNSIKNNSFSHAYMFFGPRGTGKTTVSKIFARSINCLKNKDGNSCGKCDSCKISFSKECVDIIEIDAASNNGVDEIRELRNKISLVPAELKYKVYIIDEVHMLSLGAFNALLKTLEEPPDHVVFILATTDPQKVPETIVSRCQCFSFRRISDNFIVDRLKYVCDQEKIDIDAIVLDKIAFLSDGGLRDALGMLDKLVSYTKDKITIDDFNDISGIISDDEIYEFIITILNFEINIFLDKLNNYYSCGKNIFNIINQMINYSRNIIVDYYIHNTNVDFSIDLLLNLVNYINEKIDSIKSSGNVKIYFEMLILKFINDNNKNVDTKRNDSVVEKTIIEKSNSKLIENTLDNVKVNNTKINVSTEIFDNDTKIDTSVDNDNSTIENVDNNTSNDLVYNDENRLILNIRDILDVRINNTFASASKDLLNSEKKNFELLKDYTFDQSFGYIICSILDSKLRAVGTKNMIISFENESSVKQNLINFDKINEIYNDITHSDKKIAIVSDEEWDKLKNEYIQNKKSNYEYKILDEPEHVFEELKKDDIISNSAVELFGDIVEIE